MKINIRESLNRLDLQTDNKYDLRNTYDCSNISDNKKKKLAEALNKNASAKTISKILDESYGGYDYYLIEFFVDGRRYEEEYTDTSAKEALERFKEDYSDDDYKIREIYKLTGEGYVGLGYPFIKFDESLNEEHDDFDPKYDARYEVNAYYESPRNGNYASLEDDFYTDDFEEVKDWVWEKCQKGLYINVVDRENGNEVNINTENYDFESDDAYRVFDDLDELSPLSESLNEEDNFDSDEYEREHIIHLVKSVKEASKRKGINISNLKKTVKRYIENHKDTSNKKELDELIKVYKSLDKKEESLKEESLTEDNSSSNLYLYHATDSNNVESILKKGLLINPGKHNWEGMYTDDAIFLALDANVAEDYAYESNSEPEEVTVLKVKLNDLDSNYIRYDWNNRCEYHDDINSCAYYKNIPGNLLKVCDPSSEPIRSFDDFEGTELYNILYDTFDSEVETNLELESLKEAIDNEIDLDYETDFDDGEVEEGNTFIEDGRTWSWIERIAGPIHLDFDNWSVWSARDWDYIEEKVKPLLINKEEFNVEVLTKIYDEAEVAYFVVDEDTGFIDWGPVETSTEAQDFLNGKVEDYENDEEYREIEIEEESLNESKNIEDTGYSVILHYDDIGNKRNSEYDYEVNKDDFIDGMFDIVYEDEDAPENYDQCLEWIMDNFETLVNKYKNKILDYFFDDAQEDFFNK